MSLTVAPVADAADLAAARTLCRDFRDWLYAHYAAERAHLEDFYGPAALAALLADLPRLHAPPGGVILLARRDGQPAGCAMLARIDARHGEVKRVYVAPAARAGGVGRRLMEALIQTAREAGYAALRLDTGPRQAEAIALYERLGFRRIAPYHDPGDFWRERLVYMERAL